MSNKWKWPQSLRNSAIIWGLGSYVGDHAGTGLKVEHGHCDGRWFGACKSHLLVPNVHQLVSHAPTPECCRYYIWLEISINGIVAIGCTYKYIHDKAKYLILNTGEIWL